MRLQSKATATLIPCILRGLYEGGIRVKLHEFDEILTGLKNIDEAIDLDVIGRVASLWYYFTKVFHQSLGPRIGNFAEKFISSLINGSGKYKVKSINTTLGKALRETLGIQIKYRNMIDYVIMGQGEGLENRAAFVELRTSEHTGGRTGQESLMDKFDKILDLAMDEIYGRKFSGKHLMLVIAIMFTEKNHELIDESNYNKGRLSSLISYIMEENHIWGRIRKMAERGFQLCDNQGPIRRSILEKTLHERRRICLRKEEFTLEFRIMFGDEFFVEFTGNRFKDLFKASIIADDIWSFYSLALNEFKVAKEFGETNVRRLYMLLLHDTEDMQTNILAQFSKLYDNRNTSIEKYFIELNRIINSCSYRVLQKALDNNIKLRLLEDNDATKQFNYLRYICVGVLALYLARNLGKNPLLECKWEE